MFGRKKKENNNTIKHSILGDIIADAFIHTANPFQINLFGKEYPVYIYVNSSDYVDARKFTEEQEKAIEYFASNISLISEKIEKQLCAFFGLEDSIIFNKSLTVENISVSSRGEMGILFNSSFSDDELVNMEPGIDFTDAFGIAFFPEIRMLYNEEECYKFDS